MQAAGGRSFKFEIRKYLRGFKLSSLPTWGRAPH
jgi:hypothetical protein